MNGFQIPSVSTSMIRLTPTSPYPTTDHYHHTYLLPPPPPHTTWWRKRKEDLSQRSGTFSAWFPASGYSSWWRYIKTALLGQDLSVGFLPFYPNLLFLHQEGGRRCTVSELFYSGKEGYPTACHLFYTPVGPISSGRENPAWGKSSEASKEGVIEKEKDSHLVTLPLSL